MLAIFHTSACRHQLARDILSAIFTVIFQFLSHASHLAVHSAICLVEEMFCNTPPVLHVECAATLCNRSQSIHVLLLRIPSNTRNHKSITCKFFAYFKMTFFQRSRILISLLLDLQENNSERNCNYRVQCICSETSIIALQLQLQFSEKVIRLFASKNFPLEKQSKGLS